MQKAFYDFLIKKMIKNSKKTSILTQFLLSQHTYKQFIVQ
jgi:hypothetical protein